MSVSFSRARIIRSVEVRGGVAGLHRRLELLGELLPQAHGTLSEKKPLYIGELALACDWRRKFPRTQARLVALGNFFP